MTDNVILQNLCKFSLRLRISPLEAYKLYIIELFKTHFCLTIGFLFALQLNVTL